MARTCRWCGRTYEDSIYWGCCSEKCYLESEGRDPASQAQEEMRANLAKARKQMEHERERTREEERRDAARANRELLAAMDERLKRERKQREQERKQEREERERDRKRDPRNWFGSEWAEHLSKRPEDVFKCDWSKLDGKDCATLFSAQPKLAPENIDWTSRLTGEDWTYLLVRQPQFANVCKWNKLDVNCWSNLLQERPQFVDKCALWSCFGSAQWVPLLKKQPQLAKSEVIESEMCKRFRIAWTDRISGTGWVELINANSRFAAYCSWEKVPKEKLAELILLIDRVDVERFARWDDILGEQWGAVIKKYPDLIEKRNNWDDVPASIFLFAATDHPEIIGRRTRLSDIPVQKFVSIVLKCPDRIKDDALMTTDQWVEVLTRFPDLVGKFKRLSDINEAGWVKLIKGNRNLAPYCAWENLSRNQLAVLLQCRDDISKCTSWEKFSSEQLDVIAQKFPDLVDKCPNKGSIDHTTWFSLIKRDRSMAESCPWHEMLNYEIVELLECYEDLDIGDEWNRLDNVDWCKVLRKNPCYADKCAAWVDFLPENWVELLREQPQFADKCGSWKDFKGRHWVKLLSVRPELADRCEQYWGALTENDWDELLSVQAQFANKCRDGNCRVDEEERSHKSGIQSHDEEKARTGCQLGCLGTLIKLVIWCAVIWYGLSVGVSFVDCSRFEVPEKARVVLNRMSGDGMKVREWVLGLIVKAQDAKEDESEK